MDREQLYRKYKEAIALSESLDSFNETDLIEIFDYAGDIYDDFVRLEVLLDGARRFPDSESLLVRRGYFFSDISPASTDVFMAAHSDQRGLLWDILRLYDADLEPDEMNKTLDRILENSTDVEFSDEEIIRLTNLAWESNCVDWLIKNLDKLRLRTPYVPTLLYEVAHIYEQTGHTDLALPLYRELTELEPFNADFWECLAAASMAVDDYEQAENAADYALAIQPESESALQLKSTILYKVHRDADRALEIARALFERNQENVAITAWIIQILSESDRLDEIEPYIKSYMRFRPSSRWGANIWLKLGLQPDKMLERYYSCASGPGYDPDKVGQVFGDVTSERYWIEWAYEMINDEKAIVALAMMTFYATYTGKELTEGLRTLAISLMLTKHYSEASMLFIKWLSEIGKETPHEIYGSTLAMLAFCTYSVGIYDQAEAMIEQLEGLVTGCNIYHSPDGEFTLGGIRVFINNMRKALADAQSGKKPSHLSLSDLMA